MRDLSLEKSLGSGLRSFSLGFNDVDQVRELFRIDVTQLALGNDPGLVRGAIAEKATVTYWQFQPEAVMHLELPRDCVCFSMPVAGGERWIGNGIRANDHSLVLHGERDSVFGRADKRRTLGAGLNRDLFLDDFAALTGQEREGLMAPSGRIELSWQEKQNLASAMWQFLEQGGAVAGAAIQDRDIVHFQRASHCTDDFRQFASKGRCATGQRSTCFI